jgi:hypothetical protein
MKRLLLLSLSVFTTTFSTAQIFDDLENILAATTDDAGILFDAYTAPLGESFTYSLNTGWASSAKTHKKLGFDLTIGVTSPSVSDAAKSFNINELKLTQLTASSATANTIFGPKGQTDFTYTIPDTSISQTVTLPGGLEDELVMNSLPVPYVQAGIGLFFDTDVTVRYLPKVEAQGAEIDLIGVGLKHNLMQYFGIIDKLPLNVSVLGSFTKLNVEYALNSAAPDQKISGTVDTFLVQALGSLDFPIISVFGGIGYGKGDVSFAMLGDYNISLLDGSTKTLTDPLSSDQAYTGTHALIGLRANLLFLKLFANYTIQEFNTLNLGVSVSFR